MGGTKDRAGSSTMQEAWQGWLGVLYIINIPMLAAATTPHSLTTTSAAAATHLVQAGRRTQAGGARAQHQHANLQQRRACCQPSRLRHLQ